MVEEKKGGKQNSTSVLSWNLEVPISMLRLKVVKKMKNY